MKIIQLFTNLRSDGQTTFTNEYYKALKLYGCEVKQYYSISSDKSTKATLIDPILYEGKPEQLNDMNSADFVFLHSIPIKTNLQESIDLWYDLVINKITAKKVLFLNAQTIFEYKTYNIDTFRNHDFMNAVDYICTFTDKLQICNIIRETLGEEEFNKKFVHLQHAMTFKDSDKENWLPFEDKYARCIYMGRFASKKHPERLIDICKHDTNKEFDYEMRGIMRLIAPASKPDFFYKMEKQEDGSYKNVGPSDYTEYISNKWKKEHGFAEDDLMIDDYPHKKMYIFGEYKLEDGLEAMRKSMFGLECFQLKNGDWYGNNIEYAMFEIVTMGSIPIFDKFTGEHVFMTDENGNEKSIYELGLGLFLESNLSNVDEVLSQMIELKNDKAKYDEMRNKCWKYYKDFTDPLTVITKFLNCICK